jgi:DNA repair protein RecN (Recombination protein N)
MLTSLSIKNYALIEELSVNFMDDLSIITGETGAGKSILLGALGLVLGNRADLSTLNNSEKKCVIEAVFNVKNYGLLNFFEENDIDFEEETIIRREILPSGKSRAFINDTPTTLSVLSSLSEQLIDVHSQHQTLQLSDVNFQFQIIDALSNTDAKIKSFKRGLTLYNTLKRELHQLVSNQKKEKEQYEYNLHLYKELEAANLKENEQEEVEQELDKLNNIEAIKLNLSEAQAIAFNEEVGLQTLLNSFTNNLNSIQSYSSEYKELFERINSIKIEFDDVAAEIEQLNESVDLNESHLEKLNDRLQLMFNLQKKHLVTSNKDLLAIFESLSEKISAVENSAEIVEAKETELNEVAKKIDALAKSIFEQRKKAIPVLVDTLENLLSVLGMENTRVQFNLKHTNSYYANGKDELEFLISANKGQNFGELKKIASGGELSRMMLSIKAMLSKYKNLPTIIFDEIDSGVSGDISQKMAEIMAKMSENMQVITITHLPQIAAKGNQHYKVFKQDLNNNIVTKLKLLNTNERIVEIAEMLSGKDYSATAIEHAKQLLN